MAGQYKVVFNPFTQNLDYVRKDDAGGNIVLENVACDAAVEAGDWVRMSGGQAVRAQADNATNGNVIGVCEEKISPTVCNIRVLGVTAPIYAGLTENAEYYLSDTLPGKMSLVAPTASGTVVIKVGQAFTAQEFLVLKGLRLVRS